MQPVAVRPVRRAITEVTGQFLLNVEGFRGIYYIGAAFDPAPMGWLKSPNGRKVDGIGSLLKLRTHKDADRPFVYLSRVSFRTSNIVFGDFLQFGGAAPAGRWGGWPDLYRYKILAEPLFGWTGYWGGSFSQYVSHSEWVKALSAYISSYSHMAEFSRGAIDTRPIVLYLTGASFMLFATMKVVESRKWN